MSPSTPRGRKKETLPSRQSGPKSCLTSVTPGKKERHVWHCGGPGGVMLRYVTRGTRHSHRVGSLTDHQARKRSSTDADGALAALQTADQHAQDTALARSAGSRSPFPGAPSLSLPWFPPGEQTRRSLNQRRRHHDFGSAQRSEWVSWKPPRQERE